MWFFTSTLSVLQWGRARWDAVWRESHLTETPETLDCSPCGSVGEYNWRGSMEDSLYSSLLLVPGSEKTTVPLLHCSTALLVLFFHCSIVTMEMIWLYNRIQYNTIHSFMSCVCVCVKVARSASAAGLLQRTQDPDTGGRTCQEFIPHPTTSHRWYE
jgi:hypothetical protein